MMARADVRVLQMLPVSPSAPLRSSTSYWLHFGCRNAWMVGGAFIRLTYLATEATTQL